MESKVKELLKSHKLYDENKPFDLKDSNKIENFFENYQNKKNIKNYLSSKKRNENGHIILDEIPFIKSNLNLNTKIEDGQNYKFWIVLDNNQKYLIKDMDYDFIENELVIMYFLKKVNMACANYDVVTYMDNSYISSPSFKNNNEKMIYHDDYEYDKISKMKKEYEKYKLDLFYLKTILTDELFGNFDRFPYNFAVLKRESKNNKNEVKEIFKICPLYDNGECIFSSEHNLLSVNGEITPSTYDRISYLLSDNRLLLWLENIVSKVKLEDIVSKIYEDKNIMISSLTYSNFYNYLKKTQDLFNDEIKTKGKTFKIKMV